MFLIVFMTALKLYISHVIKAKNFYEYQFLTLHHRRLRHIKMRALQGVSTKT
jgi:hypothetical protein